ncbi:MAG: hypothetical protein EA377_11690 [Phycisphaerales bacterium]|nr:MAG: hypothetical protein EA377_11690 [Phycisphaerales bacterium]
MTSMGSLRSKNLPLLAGLLVSIVLHLAVIVPVLMVSMTSEPAEWSLPEQQLRVEESEPRAAEDDDDDFRLGIDESQASTLTWVGYDEYEEHLAQRAEFEQAAFTQDPAAAQEPQPEIELPPIPEDVDLVTEAEPDEPQPEPTIELTDAERAASEFAVLPEEQPHSDAPPESIEQPDAEPEHLPSDEALTDAPPSESVRPPFTLISPLDSLMPSPSDEPGPPAPIEEPDEAIPDEDVESDPDATRDEVQGDPGPKEPTEAREPDEPAESRTPDEQPNEQGESAEDAEETETGEAKPAEDASEPEEADDDDTPASDSSEPTPPSEGPTSDDPPTEGEDADKDADATSIHEVPYEDWRLGRPLAAEGLELKPQRPHFTLLQRMNAAPGNPIVQIDFGADGVPRRAEILHSTGQSSIDSSLLSSLYRWRAEGDSLSKLKDGQTVNIRIEIVFSRRGR